MSKFYNKKNTKYFYLLLLCCFSIFSSTIYAQGTPNEDDCDGDLSCYYATSQPIELQSGSNGEKVIILFSGVTSG